MEQSETEKLYGIIAPFAGLADDDRACERFSAFDPDDEDRLAAVIREFLLDRYRSLPRERRDAGMAVLDRLAKGDSRELERAWDRILPPFSYPQRINLFRLIYDVLSREGSNGDQASPDLA